MTTNVQQETETVLEATFSKWQSIAIVSTIAIVIIALASSTYYAINKAEEAQQAAKVLTTSTWAIIDSLLTKRQENKKQWSELEKQQEKLNQSTEAIDGKLEKLNISVIN